MSDKKKRVFWYCVAIGLIILFLLILISAILNIGERLRNISQYVEWVFYALCVVLVWFLILNPIRIIVFSPSLSIVTTLEKDSLKAHQTYKAVTKNILKNNETILTEEEKNALQSYKNYEELRSALALTFHGSVKKEIRKIIVRNAKTVMISTAISQNAKLDMFSVVSVDLRMIKEIVQACGYRPSMKNLSKLTAKVASTALIADGLESISLDDVLPNSAIQTIGNVPFLKPIMSSVIQGLTNAMLTVRIGLVTRGYLFSDGSVTTKNQIRVQAFKDSVTIMPQVVGEVLAIFPTKIVRLFTKKKKDNEEENDTVVASNALLTE